MTRSPFIATLLAAALTLPAAAQATDADTDWSICDIDPARFAEEVLPQLSGSWTAQNLAGHAVMSGMGASVAVPMPPAPPEAVDLVFYGDGTLSATQWESASDLQIDFALATGPTLLDAAAGFIPGGEGQLDSDDATTLAGCDLSAYPHLTTSGSMAGDGGRMVWTGTLTVLAHDVMVGAMQFEMTGDAPGRIDGFRMVNLTR